MSDRTAAGILLIAAGVAWIVYYRRLSGSQRDALAHGLSSAGSGTSAPAAPSGSSGSSGGGGGVIPSPEARPGPYDRSPEPPPPGGSWRPSWSHPGHSPSQAERWNKVRNDFLRAWKIILPGAPPPGGDKGPLPTPPVVPSRGGL